jgi:hypothetical protein
MTCGKSRHDRLFGYKNHIPQAVNWVPAAADSAGQAM